MEVSKQHHVYPWNNLGRLLGLSSLIVLITILTDMLRRRGVIDVDLSRRVMAIVGAMLTFSISTFIAVELLQISIFASAMLTRSSVFLIPIAAALITCQIVRKDLLYQC